MLVAAVVQTLAVRHARLRPPQMQMATATAPAFALCSEDEIKSFPPKVTLEPGWFEKWGLTAPASAAAKSASKVKAKGKPSKKKGAKGKVKSPPASAGFGAAASKPFCRAPSAEHLTVVRAVPPEGQEDVAAGSPDELRQWGAAARHAIEEHIDRSGGVLLRGLPMRSAEEFAHFWKGCLEEACPEPLEEGRYTSLGPAAGRDKISGVDLATNVPPDFLLLNHNELCYNPVTVGRIGLYCVQDAPVGGESTIARNCDLGTTHPPSVRAFLEEHGGIVYRRVFYDATNPPPPNVPTAALGSWQGKCSLPDDASRADAEAFFLGMGFAAHQLEWDLNGCITVTNMHPGYVRDPATGEDDSWWNIVHTGSLTAADGTPFPPKLVADVQRTAWEHTYAFKLRPGDWLMLDNMRVQHGRLPYEASAEQKRCLLTVYSNPRPST